VLVAALAGLSGSARAGFPGADGAISFDSNGAIAQIEAGKLTTIVPRPATDGGVMDARWSPDGKTLAYLHWYHRGIDREVDSDLMTLDVATGQTNRVTSAGLNAYAWSPDGTAFAVVCGSIDICVIDRGGTVQRRFTVATGAYPTDIAWSPDGRIAYVIGSPPSHLRVYVVNMDGSNAHPVSPAETDARLLAWSPDGKNIAYTEQSRLDMVDSDGNNWHVVTTSGNPISGLSWSPNGKSLVYSDGVVRTVDIDGSHENALTDPATGNPIVGTAPDWQRLPLLPAVVTGPAVSGVVRVGQTLTASPGTWSGDAPQTYAYRWQRCAAACLDTGVTTQTYTVTTVDAGSRLRVVVSAANSAGTATATSGLTTAVPKPEFTTIRALRRGLRVNLGFVICDASPAAVVVAATDWAVVNGHHRDTHRHTWTYDGPGCHTTHASWTVARRGSRVVSYFARDGDGVWISPRRLTLR